MQKTAGTYELGRLYQRLFGGLSDQLQSRTGLAIEQKLAEVDSSFEGKPMARRWSPRLRLRSCPRRWVKPSRCPWYWRSRPFCSRGETAVCVAKEKFSGAASSLCGLGWGLKFPGGVCLGDVERAAPLRDLLGLRDQGAPSSMGARSSTTAQSRLCRSRLCQQLQLALRPILLNRRTLSTKNWKTYEGLPAVSIAQAKAVRSTRISLKRLQCQVNRHI